VAISAAETMTLEVTWTLNKKSVLLLSLVLILPSFAAADYYYDRGSEFSSDTSFSVPQYHSQEEILSQLVAPFIFLSVLLHIGFSRALRFAYVDDDNDLLDLMEDNRPNVNRKAMTMAITVTAMLVPTSFWELIRASMAVTGTAAAALVAAGALYIFYLFIKG